LNEHVKSALEQGYVFHIQRMKDGNFRAIAPNLHKCETEPLGSAESAEAEVRKAIQQRIEFYTRKTD
jgi:hypothetical protein